MTPSPTSLLHHLKVNFFYFLQSIRRGERRSGSAETRRIDTIFRCCTRSLSRKRSISPSRLNSCKIFGIEQLSTQALLNCVCDCFESPSAVTRETKRVQSLLSR
uniref:Uncharacterized protein n=2 Tax=Physcomitrium patens TaxID=3218 RepID=A0A2K1IQH9_PHYPA|nr:hypothetical protein PHYPA_025648 [Physcomitrium patens]